MTDRPRVCKYSYSESERRSLELNFVNAGALRGQGLGGRFCVTPVTRCHAHACLFQYLVKNLYSSSVPAEYSTGALQGGILLLRFSTIS
jgi:hypothetical protein